MVAVGGEQDAGRRGGIEEQLAGDPGGRVRGGGRRSRDQREEPAGLPDAVAGVAQVGSSCSSAWWRSL